MAVRDWCSGVTWPTKKERTRVNLPKVQKGGLDVAWFVVYTGQGTLDEEGYKKALDNAQAKFEAIHRLVQAYAPDKIGLATSRETIAQLRKEGKKVEKFLHKYG